MSSVPKLSVHIVTYNQERFIGQALDSALMQRTSFEYEIVVGDDASTDGTPKIIKEYQRRWPGKVKPLFRERNLGPGRNAVDTLEKCNGDYVAFLEGDDYWTDPEKVQTQADYLDKHPDCVLIHHAVGHISWPAEKSLGEHPAMPFRIDRPSARMLSMVNFIQTCSVMFRRHCLPPLDEQYRDLKIGDWPLFVLLAQRGWIGYIDRTMAHYRVHPNNAWNNRPAEYKIKAMERMANYLAEHVHESSRDYWEETLLALAFKDFVLTMQTFALEKSLAKLKRFVNDSVKFKKPFWLLSSLWPYYRASVAVKRANMNMR